MKSPIKRVQYATSLDIDTIKKLKHYAIDQGIAANTVIEKAIDYYIDTIDDFIENNLPDDKKRRVYKYSNGEFIPIK